MRGLPLAIAAAMLVVGLALGQAGSLGWCVVFLVVAGVFAGMWSGMQMPKPRSREPAHKPVARRA